MNVRLESRWSAIREASGSSDPFDRTSALALAVKLIETALTAVGVERFGREGVQARLARWEPISRLALDIPLRRAFEARNLAIHGVNFPGDASEHVVALHDLWCAIRRSYVTKEKAASVAEDVLQSGIVREVFLFGSLSRRKRRDSEPGDIDLLLFDTGEVSSFAASYWRIARNPELLESEFLDADDRRAASLCGWLDLVVIDGTRFGTDSAYTLSLCGNQADGLFFLNIADALLKYERGGHWIADRPQVFERLANLRRQLVTENIVSKRT